MLTPAGGGICRSYFSGLVWLQSWGPLYAILHRISMGEAAERMSAGALMPGRRRRRVAHCPGRDSGRGLRRGGDVRLPVDVGAVPRRGTGLRGREGDRARDLGALGRPGCGVFGGAGRHDGQYLARQHPSRHASLRNGRGKPGPHLVACRHGPLHRVQSRGRGLHRDRGRHRGGGRRFRHEPDPGGRASDSPNPLRRATRTGRAPHGNRRSTGRPRPPRRARRPRPIRRPWSSGSRAT